MSRDRTFRPARRCLGARVAPAKPILKGRGSVIIRSKTRVEEIRKDRYAIVIDEIPYQVNKASMIEKIAEQVREKTDRRHRGRCKDESDRNGVRVVVELKRDATPEVVSEPAYTGSRPMQTSFRLQHAGVEWRPPRTANAAPIF